MGDFNSHIGEECEGHVRVDPSSKIPSRVGDKDHAPAPTNMERIKSRPSSAQRGRLLLRLLDSINFVILNGRFQSASDPTPFTLKRQQEQSINDYVLIAGRHFPRVKKCVVLVRPSRSHRTSHIRTILGLC